MIKVEHTKTHHVKLPQHNNFDREFDVLVTEAKLVLIRVDNPVCGLTGIIVGMKQCDPILISETEKIEVGDWIYSSYHKSIYKVTRIDGITIIVYEKDKYSGTFSLEDTTIFKILALPEHFSKEQLQMIVDGKLKDGDKVLVECEIQKGFPESYDEFDWYMVKLNPHITIYPLESKCHLKKKYPNTDASIACDDECYYKKSVEEKMYTRDQVWNIIRDLLVSDKFTGALGNAKEWFEQNVK